MTDSVDCMRIQLSLMSHALSSPPYGLPLSNPLTCPLVDTFTLN